MSKIKITEQHEHGYAQSLLRNHNGGSGWRGVVDLNNDKRHARITLLSIKELLKKCEWTKEELLTYINSNLEGLELFNAKK